MELTKTRQELVKQGVKIKEGYASRNAPQASVQVAGDAQEGCVPRLVSHARLSCQRSTRIRRWLRGAS